MSTIFSNLNGKVASVDGGLLALRRRRNKARLVTDSRFAVKWRESYPIYYFFAQCPPHFVSSVFLPQPLYPGCRLVGKVQRPVSTILQASLALTNEPRL